MLDAYGLVNAKKRENPMQPNVEKNNEGEVFDDVVIHPVRQRV